jgi:DNA processing protein
MSLLHQIALTCTPEVGDVTARNLLSYCGSPEEVFKTKKNQLTKIPGVGPKTADQIGNPIAFERAERELRFIEKYKIKSCFITDDTYPKRLKNCADAPMLLYFKGEADFNCGKVISIVGTRSATNYGRDLCKQLLIDLKIHQPLVVSGLAHGIDSMAHKECLKNNISTIGVLGHGLDRIYPAQNRSLAESMLSCGGLLTEFTSETIPGRENFPRRNRIIAGMADATIVVEASTKGGALITAEIANSYNRDVFAFPGKVTDEYSAGCNYLIKTHRASLISKASDLEYLLGWTNTSSLQNVKPQLSLMLNLSPDEKRLVDVLQEKGNMAVDELALLCQLPQSKLAITILGLEMQGLLIALPGKVYKLA